MSNQSLREAMQQALDALSTKPAAPMVSHLNVLLQSIREAKAILIAALARTDDKAQPSDQELAAGAFYPQVTGYSGRAQPPAEQRPENCGSGHCSCVECPFKQGAELSDELL